MHKFLLYKTIPLALLSLLLLSFASILHSVFHSRTMLANMILDNQQHHSHHSHQSNPRRNSFSSFVRTLFLFVSPSSTHDNDTNDQKSQDSAESKHSNSLFMEMYFSFPALEDPESETSSINCAAEQRNSASFLVESSNRILC